MTGEESKKDKEIDVPQRERGLDEKKKKSREHGTQQHQETKSQTF